MHKKKASRRELIQKCWTDTRQESKEETDGKDFLVQEQEEERDRYAQVSNLIQIHY